MSNLLEIPPEIEILFERARELKNELMMEYEKCINDDKGPSLRAMCLTHEVLERIRVALDHTMRKYWNKHCLQGLSKEDKKKRINVYFPIRKDILSFKKFLKSIKMEDLELVDKSMYDLLLSYQPFTKRFNRWLYSLTELAGKGKHEELIKQEQKKLCIFIAESEMGSVSWMPKYLKFDPRDPNVDIKKLGAPIDPYNQSLISSPYSKIRREISIDFCMEKENFIGEGRLSAPFFCVLVIDQAHRIVKKIIELV